MVQNRRQKIDERRHSMSRRSFLRESGLGVAGSVMLDKTLPDLFDATAQAADQDVVGPGPVSITLNVNNTIHSLVVEPRATLAEALRNSLNLTGTKIGCDRGACSACTVLLDGAPIASCMMLAIDIGNRKVTTIEGLAQGGQLHPVQAAFVAHDAIQCGYCTPGLVMSCAAMLERNPNPTIEDVKAATSGHLCRCGVYPHVHTAVLDVARNRKS